MDLSLDMAVAEGYTSKSQIARRITEDWASRNLFCTACACDYLSPARTNMAVLDYTCPECNALYQLKSKEGRFGTKVSNSAYEKKALAIESGQVPHYAFLQYSSDDALVTDLFLIPGHLFSLGIVEKRNPLGPEARRAGWIGSNIMLGLLPMGVRVDVVLHGSARDPQEVREDWNRYGFIGADQHSSEGWTADILICVRRLTDEMGIYDFTLQQFYQRFLEELKLRYPTNRNVEAKIRQQLQVLRDGEVLTFRGRGRYRLRGRT